MLPLPQADGSLSLPPPSTLRWHFAPLSRCSIPERDETPFHESARGEEDCCPAPPPTSSSRFPPHSLLVSARDYNKDDCGKDASRASFSLAVSQSPVQRPLDSPGRS